MTWKVSFFSQRLEAEILALPAGFVARFLKYAERMELYGPDLGMPHMCAIQFVKKTDKTPPGELDIARRRMKEVKNG
jgi:hypothetical protein